MANSIGWGYGSSNNSIGWGQGDVNNNIAWGYAYRYANAGQTDILGNLAYLTTYENAFQSRVTTDLGTFEAYSCLYNTMLGELSNGGAKTLLFEGRVGLDSGVVEADTFLISFINNLS